MLTADLEKAYLQISVHVKDRDLMRLLCFKNEVIKMRFCRVIFGATSSQLKGTVRKLRGKYEAVEPEFARKVKKTNAFTSMI